ncbi:MAG TPA: TIGR03435 family protein [Vicinamibacterales bacterium]|nr:TIGR03435 family protein [Vicinamibacterales bacterium]
MAFRLTLSVVAGILATGICVSGAGQSTTSAGPTFDVVSVKRNAASASATAPDVRFGSSVTQRPDGGLTMLNIPAGTLVARAYSAAPIDMVGLPGWAMSERYDLNATASQVNPTAEQRAAMLRAMLADRFRLVAHVENREQPAYDLVMARSDGRLGPAIKPSEADCEAKAAADRAITEKTGRPPAPPPGVFDRNAPPPPCSLRMDGDRMEGDVTMAGLATMLRAAAGRLVVDKTGLAGSYRITLLFDRMLALRGPDTAAPAPGAAPSVFTAVQEQLGLQLESSRALRETLIIDRFERPTEN